jgi:hypothetical protein
MINKFLLWFQHSALYLFLLKKIFPYLHFRLWGYPKYPKSEYFKIREIMQNDPDHFYVFTGTDTTFLSWKIRRILDKNTKWSHAGILYLNNNKEINALHVTSKGKLNESILEYLSELDNFAIMKIPVKDMPKLLLRIKRFAEADVVVSYDYFLDLSPEITAMLDNDIPVTKQVYCSEEVYIIGNEITTNPLIARQQYGKLYFEPDDVYKSGEVVYEKIMVKV